MTSTPTSFDRLHTLVPPRPTPLRLAFSQYSENHPENLIRENPFDRMKPLRVVDELLDMFIPYASQLVICGEIAKVLGRPSARNRVEHSMTIFFRTLVQGQHDHFKESL